MLRSENRVLEIESGHCEVELVVKPVTTSHRHLIRSGYWCSEAGKKAASGRKGQSVRDILATVLEGSKGAPRKWGCLVADATNPPWRSLQWILGTTPDFSSKPRLCQGGGDSNFDFRARLHPFFFHPNISPQHAILNVQERAQLLTSSRKLLVSCSRSLCPLSSPAWTVSLPPISLPRRHLLPSSPDTTLLLTWSADVQYSRQSHYFVFSFLPSVLPCV